MPKQPAPDVYAHPPATLNLGGRDIRRLGFGAMRLPGKDVWGPPEDPAQARQVVQRAVDLGVQFIDTSWYYGPHVSNTIIAEAIHPYPADVMIATKGLTRYAAGNSAMIVRRVGGKQESVKVRLNDLLKNGDICQNVEMRPGDTLIIPLSWL